MLEQFHTKISCFAIFREEEQGRSHCQTTRARHCHKARKMERNWLPFHLSTSKPKVEIVVRHEQKLHWYNTVKESQRKI